MKGEITISINKIQDEINESRTLKEEVENGTVTGECNENKNNEGTNTKVSDEFKTSGNYDDIVKNVVLEDKINNNRGNEVLMEIQSDYERERERERCLS